MKVNELVTILEKAPPDFEVDVMGEEILIWRLEGTGRKRREVELQKYCHDENIFVRAIRFDLGVN